MNVHSVTDSKVSYTITDGLDDSRAVRPQDSRVLLDDATIVRLNLPVDGVQSCRMNLNEELPLCRCWDIARLHGKGAQAGLQA